MSRQLTEHELERIAGVMGWELLPEVYPDQDPVNACALSQDGDALLIRGGNRDFNPLHDHADLARLVEAMQADGWTISRKAYPAGSVRPHVSDWTKVSGHGCFKCVDAPTDIEATCFAIVDALKEKEKRDATDTNG